MAGAELPGEAGMTLSSSLGFAALLSLGRLPERCWRLRPWIAWGACGIVAACLVGTVRQPHSYAPV